MAEQRIIDLKKIISTEMQSRGAKVVVKGSEVLKDGWVQDAALPFRGLYARQRNPSVRRWR